MNYHKLDNYEQMSDVAAEVFRAQLVQKPDSVLGLATGTTPIGLYDRLAMMYQDGVVDFSLVKTANLDEYCGLAPDHVQSYRYFMNEFLFGRVNIEKENTHVPNGLADDFDAECKRYDALIDDMGGIDLQLLGIGQNGHIGFNEPSDFFSAGTNRVKLTESTIQANARLFEHASDVPRYALSMGIRTIMMAKKILLVADKTKVEIVEQALLGPITPKLPASVLQLHQNLTVALACG